MLNKATWMHVRICLSSGINTSFNHDTNLLSGENHNRWKDLNAANTFQQMRIIFPVVGANKRIHTTRAIRVKKLLSVCCFGNELCIKCNQGKNQYRNQICQIKCEMFDIEPGGYRKDIQRIPPKDIESDVFSLLITSTKKESQESYNDKNIRQYLPNVHGLGIHLVGNMSRTPNVPVLSCPLIA